MAQDKHSYLEKLRDPRWQRKRLEVFQRDNFACTACGDTESTLNVHHKMYEPGKDPWDYPLSSLETRCDKCHSRASDEVLLDFLDAFKLVFEWDWEFTCAILRSDQLGWYIRPGHTFLNPGVEDESNNWGNRGRLLAAYRRLVAVV